MARRDNLPSDFDPEKFLEAVAELCRVLHEIMSPIAQRINDAFVAVADEQGMTVPEYFRAVGLISQEDFEALDDEVGDCNG